MKINKKIILTSTVLLALVSPAILMQRNTTITQTVQAATKTQTGTVRKKVLDDRTIALYKKNGKVAKYQKLKEDLKIKLYGKPIFIKGGKDYNTATPPTRIIKGWTYYSLGDGGYIRTNNVGGWNYTGKISIDRNSYVYDKNGKRLKTYRGKKAYLKRNSKIKYAGNFVETDSPEMYYRTANGLYVKANDLASINGQGILRIGCNSYLYNKKGKRVGSLRKNTVTTFVGKTRTAGNKAVYFFYDDTASSSKKYELPQKMIKGQRYYALGKGRYVKAINVTKINGNFVYTTGTTYVVPKYDQYLLNRNLQETNSIARRGQKIKVNRAVVKGYGDEAQLYLGLANKSHCYLLWGEGSEYPRPAESDANLRFALGPVAKYKDLIHSYVYFKDSKKTPVYNSNGNSIKLKGLYLEQASEDGPSEEVLYTVDSGWYIWNKTENKAELYYHLADSNFSVYDQSGYNNQEFGNSFVKASEVNLHGQKIQTLNTPEQAEKATGTATTADKKQLQEEVDKASDITNSVKYRFTDRIIRARFDIALKAAKAALVSTSSTKFTVNELTWWLNQTYQALNGAKVKVKNINNLTPLEAKRILHVMNNDAGVTPDADRVDFYQKHAHKSGYYYSDQWVSSKRTVFMLIKNNGKHQVLTPADYATEK